MLVNEAMVLEGFSAEDYAYIDMVTEENFRYHLKHQIRLRNLMEHDRDEWEKKYEELLEKVRLQNK